MSNGVFLFIATLSNIKPLEFDLKLCVIFNQSYTPVKKYAKLCKRSIFTVPETSTNNAALKLQTELQDFHQ